jgi:hypothetical protein
VILSENSENKKIYMEIADKWDSKAIDSETFLS